MENNVKDEEVLVYDLNIPVQLENINSDYRNSNYKIIKIYFEELKDFILLKQDFRLGKGGIFWDGSYILTKVLNEVILLNHNISEKGSLNVLELGAGTALPSLFCNQLGHKVTITDIKKNLDLIKSIVELNSKSNTLTTNEPSVYKLNWEEEDDINSVKSFNSTFDLIICSELIYLDEYFDALINVLTQFSSPTTQIILSYKIRLPEMVEEFFSKFNKFFEYSHIDNDTVQKFYPLPNKLKILIAKLK